MAISSTARWNWRGPTAAAALLAMAATGCGPTTVDPSSFSGLQDSLSELREQLAPSDLDSFREALSYLVGSQALHTLTLEEVGNEQAAPVLELFRPLAGRTVDGVVAEARYRRVREVRSAVTALRDWKDSTEDARRELRRFRFREARVFKRHKGYLEWPVIEMEVENGTGHRISLIHFRATLLEPTKDEPWLEEEFDHVVMGGLAPGEEAVWRIEPEQRGWIRLIDPHPDLRFTLEPMRLVALGGRVLVESDWGAREDHRLATFLGTLQVMRASGTLALDLPPLPVIPALGVAPVRMVTGQMRPAPTVPGGAG